MKVASAFVAAFAALGVTATASTHNAQRKLVLGGTTVPEGKKPYYAGIRDTIAGKNFCGGTLIGPLHVLTSSHCTTLGVRWVSIGSHYNNGTQDGEQIKVVSVMNHPNSTEPLKYSNDFAILELERPSLAMPAKLAMADDSDFIAGATVTTIGTGRLSEGPTATASHELQRVDSTLATNKQCETDGKIELDGSMLCVAGQISKGFCDGDTGGPAFIEYSDNDADDVVVGIASWRNPRDGDVCGRGKSVPMIYSRVSFARFWIDPISASSCFA